MLREKLKKGLTLTDRVGLKKAAYYLSTLFSVGVLGAAFFAPTAFAAGPSVVLAQGQLDATTTQTSNGVVDEYQVFVGNGYSGPISSMVVTTHMTGSGSETAWANVVTAVVYQASTSATIGPADASCSFAASSTDYIASTDTLSLQHIVGETNGGCMLRPDWYTAVGINYQRTFSTLLSAYTYGSTQNNKGWNWAHTGFNGIDCANYWNGVSLNNICYSQGPNGTGFYPMFDVLGPGWSLVPTTTSSGIFFSGAVGFCNNAFGTTTSFFDDPAASFSKGLCMAAGFLFIPTSDSVSAFQGIPNQIASSFPFSWITQMRTILSAATASSSDTFIDLNLNFGTSTQVLGFTQLDVISTTTISRYMSDTTRNNIKALLAALFYLAAAAFIYRELQKVWQTA